MSFSNPHLYIITTDGCFYDQGGFMIGPHIDPKALEQAFRLEVFKLLKKEGKITDTVINNMLGWHHSRFNIFCSRPTDPDNQSEDDYSQLPAEELCLKHTSSG